MAVWALVHAIIDRPTGPIIFMGLGALELLLIAQLVISIVLLPGSHVDGVLLIGYIVTAILIVAGAGFWAFAEVSRWGAGVLVIACLAIAVMTVRMQQIWG